MAKIAIFSGSFDPIHKAHIKIASKSVDELSLDRLYFLVEEKPRSSKTPIGLKHRIKMLELATRTRTRLSYMDMGEDRFSISTTLPVLEQMFFGDELYFIFGADVFLRMNFQKWSMLAELFKHRLVVFDRIGISRNDIKAHAKELSIEVVIMSSPHPKVSSSEVRANLGAGLDIPESVADYIFTYDLY